MVALKYSFRPNLFQRSRTVQLSQDGLQVLNSGGDVVRTVPLCGVRCIQEYSAGRFENTQSGGHTLSQCVLSFVSGSSIVLKSASYEGPHRARDQSSEYRCFLDELTCRVARANPSARILQGGRGIQISFILLTLIGALLAFGGVVVLASPLFSNQQFSGVIPLSLPMIIGGISIGMKSWGFALLYKPVERTAADVLGIKEPTADLA